MILYFIGLRNRKGYFQLLDIIYLMTVWPERMCKVWLAKVDLQCLGNTTRSYH